MVDRVLKKGENLTAKERGQCIICAVHGANQSMDEREREKERERERD